MKGNVIVGQSGGPTAVINSSLVGVYKTAKDRGAKKIYGMLHGVQGLLEEKGRLELPGRPLLYGTTPDFLRCFGFSSLDELPPLPDRQEGLGGEEAMKAEQTDG